MSSFAIKIIGAIVIALAALVDIAMHGHFSDAYLAAEVNEALRGAGYNSGERAPIKVRVDDGWVVLDGSVPTKESKGVVAQAVGQGVNGIRGITNNLNIASCDASVIRELTKLVTSVDDDAAVSHLVDANCKVTLTGWVSSEETKKAVGTAAASAHGVTGVDNNLEVAKPEEQHDVGQAIEGTIAKILRVQNIYFDFNAHTIRAESMTSLDSIAEILKKNPGRKVSIEGHTDSIATDAYNQGLSERRASAVLEALVERGVARSRLRAVGFGESRAIASNKTPEGRAENRRIEFDVL